MRPLKALSLLILTCMLAFSLSLGGCKRDPADLEEWRPSRAANGLKMMTKWIGDGDEPMNWRVRCAELLLEENYASNVDEALAKATPEDRKAILTAILPKLLSDYKLQDATIENYQTNNSKQVFAKEALFALRKHVKDPALKKQIDDTLLDWLSKDFYTRNQMGSYRNNQIAEVVGKPAIEPLVKAVGNPENKPLEVIEALKRIKDPSVPEQAAKAIAALGKKELPKLTKGTEVAILTENHPAIVPLLIEIVDNDKVDLGIRGKAHERIGAILKVKALPTYLKWVKSSPGDLRWLSVQAIAETQGKIGIKPMLAAFPAGDKYDTSEPDVISREAGRFCMVDVKEMKANLEPIFADALKDTKMSPVAKAISLRCLQEIGTAKTSKAAVEALKEDESALPAWENAKTLGELAVQTLPKLK